jgi:hypothetical protein
MGENVVDMKGTARRRHVAQVPDFWFAQVDVRLGRIELMVMRLEWQIWLLVCGAAGLLIFEIIKILND